MITSARLSLIVLLFFGTFQLSNAEEGASPKSSDDQTVRERNRTSMLNDAELRRWSFTFQDDQSVLTVSAEPAMRWSHFDIGRYYGDLHVVTAKGRPVVVFAMFRWFHPVSRAYVCATSLDDSQLVASRNGKILWQPRDSALQWKPLPNAKLPGDSRPTRLVQMRHYARRFSGEASDHPVADAATFKKLRLLPQPIYRYSTNEADGAIFVFAHGTTPAVLLCLEADLSPNTAGWRYGFARRWSFESRMNYEQKYTWTAPSVRPRTQSQASYYLSVIPE